MRRISVLTVNPNLVSAAAITVWAAAMISGPTPSPGSRTRSNVGCDKLMCSWIDSAIAVIEVPWISDAGGRTGSEIDRGRGELLVAPGFTQDHTVRIDDHRSAAENDRCVVLRLAGPVR